MSLTYTFLIARAEEAARDADNAVLDNVRERAMRSEAAWRDMADRALQVEQDREEAKRQRELRPVELAGPDVDADVDVDELT